MKPADHKYCGDEEGFVNLLEVYFMDGKRKLDLLCDLVETDILRYQVEVHGLKSASANIGALKVSDMAREQENAAAQSDREFIYARFPAMLTEYETLLDNIGQFLERRRQSTDQKDKLPCPPISDLRMQTAGALEELKHFRSRECAEKVEAMLAHELPKDVLERLLQIQQNLRLYEDDNAEEMLGQLLSVLEKEEESK